ncbi:hypothetical protein K501DRAFT_291915 [Backusella circina FSU 941]|nr:hypothetical protein K501DRAFT_291915 [Backusella circina FSU 941]
MADVLVKVDGCLLTHNFSKSNLFQDGVCYLNQTGWSSQQSDDWIYYPQQYVNISLTAAKVSFALVGGCCAPNRYKPTGFLYQDDGATYETTGNKIMVIADRPISQNITVEGWYMKKFVDDGAMNLTVIPSIRHADKQSVLYEVIAFDRGMLIEYQFYNNDGQFIGNFSSGVLRNTFNIPDITLPKFARSIVTTTFFQYLSLANFLVIPITFCVLSFITDFTFPPPIRFLGRTPSPKILMCIIMALGSFIFNQAWNLINSQSSIFHPWLPRAAKLVGFFTTCTLFGLRLALDLPSYVITYARSFNFLIINVLVAIPTFISYCAVLLYFIIRFCTYEPCRICNIEFLEVSDIEENYLAMTFIRRLFGLNEFVRIPFAIKTSLTLLLYCLFQLIPLLLTELIGVGGIVPVYVCSWTPYLAQLQYHPDPMYFAQKTFMLSQIAVYVATLGGGGCFTGTLYFMVEIAFIGAIIIALVMLDRLRDVVFQHVGYGVFFASLFIAWLVQLIQKRITNLVFVENQSKFNLQNRSPLLHYWYFMMLTSMTRALTSYILRTLKLLVRYPLFSTRVDRNAETWSVRRGDGGFSAYCGMILTEHEYNNPVVLFFIECIFDSVDFTVNNNLQSQINSLCTRHRRKRNNEAEREELIWDQKESGYVMDAKRKRARTRWFLAYTLIRNPRVSIS